MVCPHMFRYFPERSEFPEDRARAVGGFQVKIEKIAIYPINFWLFGLVPNGILREDSSSDILNKLNGNGNGSAWYPSWLAKHDGWSVRAGRQLSILA